MGGVSAPPGAHVNLPDAQRMPCFQALLRKLGLAS